MLPETTSPIWILITKSSRSEKLLEATQSRLNSLAGRLINDESDRSQIRDVIDPPERSCRGDPRMSHTWINQLAIAPRKNSQLALSWKLTTDSQLDHEKMNGRKMEKICMNNDEYHRKQTSKTWAGTSSPKPNHSSALEKDLRWS
jgi:DNA polymerase sigma